jgi:predicted nucleic acid-binding protein
VSLLLPETLHLYVAPDKVLGVKTAGLKASVVGHGQINVKVDGADGWAGVGAACHELLKSMPSVDRMRVVLSSAFVRFGRMPWRDDLRSADEELALAKMQFEDVYGGDTSADWHFAFSDVKPGRTRLSVAVPVSLYTLLRSGMPEKAPKVTSIDTAFTSVAAGHKKHMPADAWFVNLEGQRLTFGHWNRSGWVWISALRASVSNFDEFAAILRRELTISGATLNTQSPTTVVLNISFLNAQNMKIVDGVRFVFLKASGIPNHVLSKDADFFQLGLSE